MHVGMMMQQRWKRSAGTQRLQRRKQGRARETGAGLMIMQQRRAGAQILQQSKQGRAREYEAVHTRELKCCNEGRARELDDATGRRALSQQKQERVRELRCCNTERY